MNDHNRQTIVSDFKNASGRNVLPERELTEDPRRRMQECSTHARKAVGFSPATPLHLHFSPSVFLPPTAFLSFSRPPPTFSGGCKLIGRSVGSVGLSGGLPPMPSSLSSGSGRGRSRKVATRSPRRYTTSPLASILIGEVVPSKKPRRCLDFDEPAKGCCRPRSVPLDRRPRGVAMRAPVSFSPLKATMKRKTPRNANVHRPRRDIGVESSTTERSGPPTYLLFSATTAAVAARRSHSLLSAPLTYYADESGVLARSRLAGVLPRHDERVAERRLAAEPAVSESLLLPRCLRPSVVRAR